MFFHAVSLDLAHRLPPRIALQDLRLHLLQGLQRAHARTPHAAHALRGTLRRALRLEHLLAPLLLLVRQPRLRRGHLALQREDLLLVRLSAVALHHTTEIGDISD